MPVEFCCFGLAHVAPMNRVFELFILIEGEGQLCSGHNHDSRAVWRLSIFALFVELYWKSTYFKMSISSNDRHFVGEVSSVINTNVSSHISAI